MSHTASFRRSVPLLAVALLAAAALAAGCGSSSKSSSSSGTTAATAPAANPADFPAIAGRTLPDLINALPKGPVLAPSVSVLDQGVNRVGFALFSTGGKQIPGAEVALYVGKTDGSDAAGPFVARDESLKVAPQFESKTTANDPDSARGVYVADVKFPRNGKYAVLALAKINGKMVATSPTGMIVGAKGAEPPGPGTKAPLIHTLTVKDVGGNLSKIDTRIPPAPSLLQTDYADAYGKRPIVITFATPQLCQSRVCGPVVDVVDQVAAKYGSKVAFIHQEVYADNNPSKGLRPQLVAFHLQSEPWTFVIDRTGRVSTRFEGAISPAELDQAVQKVL